MEPFARQYPPFSLHRQRFDQTTYIGRLKRCFDVVDPRTLLVTNKKLNESLRLLDSFREGTISSDVSDKQLWQARKIKEAILHPDTGEKIFMPFRMSGYVPFGTITVVGMLLPNPSLAQVIFWQWLNQSHNACVNYANRNATKPTPASRFVTSYVGAVTSAVAIAVGLSVGIKRAKFLTPERKTLVQRFVAYPATCTANLCNVYMMRQNELREGIEVTTNDGKVIGTSKIAARKAVADTALTRVVLPAPILIFPPILMNYMEKTKFLRGRPRLHIPANALVCLLTFGLALPFAIAIFPQRSTIPTEKLEKDIQAKTQEPFLVYNKGL